MKKVKNANIVVWFSCGAASAVAAYETLRQYGIENNVTIVNNPVIEEDEDNRRFLNDVGQWLDVVIHRSINPNKSHCSARQIWAERKFMSSPLGAPCTLELKKNARRAFETKNKIDLHVLGFTAEEEKRYERFKLTERENVLAPLIEKKLTKQDCISFLLTKGIEPPRMYRLGYPNANCVGCVKATSPTYWNHVRKHHPDVFEDRAEQSRKLNVRLVRVKNKRIFLDELDQKSKGQSLKSMNFECGIFCEEFYL